ncbi:MAG: hypothetical protein JWN00_5372 [Actinomycetia bacterium]|nr:hypothetical protein [Actinomycetes bacterium]
MTITVVIRVPVVPVSFLLTIAEPGLVVAAEALGFGFLAPLAAGVVRREVERRFELGLSA